jgi:hypothetical protein
VSRLDVDAVSEIPDLETLDAFAELARQISIMKCWLCSTPIEERYDDDTYEPERGVFPICKECEGKELFPRSQVWQLMQGLQSTQNHTGRERAKLKATISALRAALREAPGHWHESLAGERRDGKDGCALCKWRVTVDALLAEQEPQE